YGSQGYNIVGNATSSPAYATVTPAGQSTLTWAASTTDPRALETAGGTGRIAAAWSAAGSFTVDINLIDGKAHHISAYLLDWDASSRSEKVEVLDAASGVVLDSRTLSSFQGGEYLVWTLQGHVQLRITNLTGPSVVLSGLFFDTQPALAAIADQTVAAGQSLTLTLQGSDPAGLPLTYSAVVDSLAYHLKSTLGLYSNGNYYTNVYGGGEQGGQGTGGGSVSNPFRSPLSPLCRRSHPPPPP